VPVKLRSSCYMEPQHVNEMSKGTHKAVGSLRHVLESPGGFARARAETSQARAFTSIARRTFHRLTLSRMNRWHTLLNTGGVQRSVSSDADAGGARRDEPGGGA
jgi:hypothetical protein